MWNGGRLGKEFEGTMGITSDVRVHQQGKPVVFVQPLRFSRSKESRVLVFPIDSIDDHSGIGRNLVAKGRNEIFWPFVVLSDIESAVAIQLWPDSLSDGHDADVNALVVHIASIPQLLQLVRLYILAGQVVKYLLSSLRNRSSPSDDYGEGAHLRRKAMLPDGVATLNQVLPGRLQAAILHGTRNVKKRCCKRTLNARQSESR
mmetsp:Transcript_34292/g.53487  ORF Transcript_34292/g.53487 Transcript_34292/m.53487 type:complete len:203 (-) Transcript_34292:580-1188(-)